MQINYAIYDDMTGVLMQCISRIPLSYRRKAKTPPVDRVSMM
nr:MAG TPA: hypothetical protein [Caudoviricetes sp.]